jgi:hypothetical protein
LKLTFFFFISNFLGFLTFFLVFFLFYNFMVPTVYLLGLKE